MSDPLTALLDTLARDAAAATPGPWGYSSSDPTYYWVHPQEAPEGVYVCDSLCGADAAHIANCDPITITALVAFVDSVRRERRGQTMWTGVDDALARLSEFAAARVRGTVCDDTETVSTAFTATRVAS